MCCKRLKMRTGDEVIYIYKIDIFGYTLRIKIRRRLNEKI